MMKKNEEVFGVIDSVKTTTFSTIAAIVLLCVIFFFFTKQTTYIIYVGLISISILLFKNALTFKRMILYDDRLEISYPLFPFVKKGVFQLDNIDYILISTAKAAPSANFIKVFLNNEKVKSYEFVGSKTHQLLINNMREMDIKIEINSPFWQ